MSDRGRGRASLLWKPHVYLLPTEETVFLLQVSGALTFLNPSVDLVVGDQQLSFHGGGQF